MIYGYARVSSTDQNLDRQLIALKKAGVAEENIFTDRQSGKDFDRPAWKKMKRRMKPGDVLFIKSIDRMGRDYTDVQEQWRVLSKVKRVDIVVLDMPLLDTRADQNLVGTLISDIVLQLLAFVAQTERENIKQRQAEGIAAARARGVRLGRPPRPLPEKFDSAYQDWIGGKITATKAAEICGMPYGTFRFYARRRMPDGTIKPSPPRKYNRTPVPRKRPEKPPYFDSVYHSYSVGGLTVTEAALLLNIPVGRFRAYAKEEEQKGEAPQ